MNDPLQNGNANGLLARQNFHTILSNRADGDLDALAASLDLCVHNQNTVGVQVEDDCNLGNTAGRRLDAVERTLNSDIIS